MMIQILMTGTTPLVQHNDQLAYPENEIVQRIKQFTDKKKGQTDDDRLQVEIK
jgi:hypothetical protein